MMRVAILSAAIAAANAAAVPSWSTPASVSESDTYDFCGNANPTNCGGQFTDSAGVVRSFDLSSMCQTDGGGYYSEDHGNGKGKDGSGHEYTANVCGNLADECPNPTRYCDVDSNTCAPDVGAASEGMVKQFGFSQGCGADSCARCFILSNNSKAPAAWDRLYRQGVEMDLSDGVSVLYSPVPVSPASKADLAWGHCGGVQIGRAVTYNFACDCDAVEPIFDSIRQGPFDKGWTPGTPWPLQNSSDAPLTDCQYTLNFIARAACYESFCNALPPPSSSGLSGGSIFLIILSVVGAVYVGGAVFSEHRYSGQIKLPESHTNACSSFCSLVGEGGGVVWAKLTGGSRQQSGGNRIPGEMGDDGGTRSLNYT